MTDDPAPPPEMPQTPVSEALPEPIIVAPSEPIPEPTPQAEASAPSEPAEPVPSEPVEVPEVEVETPRQPAASAAQPASSSPISNTSPQAARELLVKARAKIQTKKQQKLEKIMTLFEKQEKIMNDDVEKLLHCSDATALRYLNELVKQGKIKREGKTGAGVEYIKI